MSSPSALPGGEVIVYQAPDGQVCVDVRLERKTVWLTQAQMAVLFGRERSVITKHVQNVFKERELGEESNVHFLHIAGSDKPVGFYILDAIISVGYRPSAQVRAAHILYFVIKDHPFSDGNKRIGTLLFLEYLRRNGLLLRPDGAPRLADNAMVALALLIAESEAGHKDLMIRLVLNLLGDEAP